VINEYIFKRLPTKFQDNRNFLSLLEAWLSIIGNIILFIFKFIAGKILFSISLQADAFHSLSDCLTSLVIVFSIFISKKPPDKEHPHGHGRIEYIATLIIAMLLVLTSWELGKSSVYRIIKPLKVTALEPVIIILLFISAIFKEVMASFSNFLGKKIDSFALIGDAWHHRTDAIATGLVAIGLCITPFKFYWLDGVLGLLVSLFILIISVSLLKESINDLLGRAPNKSFMEKIKKEAQNIQGVINCHDISVHDYKDRKEISLHIEVPSGLSAAEAHSIAKNVEKKIKAESNDEVTIHIDPYDRKSD